MRIRYLDFLKSIAIIGVVWIHTGSNMAIDFDADSFNWWVNNIYASLARWSIPVFFMISGALLLSSTKEISIKDFYKTRVIKLLIPFLIWSLIYFVIQGFRGEYTEPLNLLTFIELFLSGNIFGRLWFFYYLLGLYMITPFIKTFVQNSTQENLKIYIIIWFLTTSAYGILNDFFNIELAINLTYIYGYIGFFILGYYLKKYDVSINKNLLYGLPIMSFVITFFGVFIMSNSSGEINNYFYGYLTPNTILISVFLLLLLRKKVKVSLITN